MHEARIFCEYRIIFLSIISCCTKRKRGVKLTARCRSLPQWMRTYWLALAIGHCVLNSPDLNQIDSSTSGPLQWPLRQQNSPIRHVEHHENWRQPNALTTGAIKF